MPKMTAMNAAVKILESEGVRHIFGIPGAGILPFYRSLKDLGTIKHLLCRHEEGAIHMADGYARAIGGIDPAKVRIEPGNQGRGFDFVKFAEACGAAGERVFDPKEIRGAFQRAVQSGRPYVIDIIMERETDCSMGVSLDAVREFE